MPCFIAWQLRRWRNGRSGANLRGNQILTMLVNSDSSLTFDLEFDELCFPSPQHQPQPRPQTSQPPQTQTRIYSHGGLRNVQERSVLYMVQLDWISDVWFWSVSNAISSVAYPWKQVGLAMGAYPRVAYPLSSNVKVCLHLGLGMGYHVFSLSVELTHWYDFIHLGYGLVWFGYTVNWMGMAPKAYNIYPGYGSDQKEMV